MTRYGPDGHSHSWLMVSEILDILSNIETFKYQIDYLRKYITDPENTRMVFWFDN